jgi:hypothetical protein
VQVLKMGGTPSVLGMELRRTRALRWLTLPVTLPFIPEFMRIWGLGLMKRLNREETHAAGSAPPDFGFGESDLFIAPDADPSVNLITFARKP